MTDLDKDYKYYKAKEWFDRPAYYINGRGAIDERRIEGGLLPYGYSKTLNKAYDKILKSKKG